MEVFKPKWFRLNVVLLANGFSLLGNGIAALVIPWFVFKLTGSAVATASVVLVGQLPNIFVGLFSGPIIDRIGAKRVSLISDAINALAVLLIPLFFSLGLLDTALLAFLVFLSQVIDIPGQTSREVMIPAFIEEDHLPREKVNGFASLIETAADFVAPLVAGILLSVMAAAWVMVIDALTFVISLLLIGFFVKFKVPKPNLKYAEKSPELIEAWKWMIHKPIIVRLVCYDMVINLVASASFIWFGKFQMPKAIYR